MTANRHNTEYCADSLPSDLSTIALATVEALRACCLAGCQSARLILLAASLLIPDARPGEVPIPLPEWRIELLASAPQLKHPSVVCSAPDGRVFVAEDPMDIVTRADERLGRILCFHPGGKVTVFADKLYAVFGMQYLEGKLYVLQNPKFTVFTDRDGIGGEGFDLIPSTNPNPWALDWNDHVPANFRLGMDGFFYIAVGDKGIYGATGRDGRRVDLHGGGIVRIRPDGTGLEVYARGNRNILDVAMNAEDEFFTYDNTDEQQWMGRLTHMVDGGFYGYPYDFIPQRPHTLWMMADYGAGAATGVLCDNDDALPSEYLGNLFLADFGKRQVTRVKVERDGATYRAVSKQELFPNPPQDFRPVGLAWSADGLSILICDWEHRDVKENVSVGKLWKLTFAKPGTALERPAWFIPAAQRQPFTASPEELLEALFHPAHSVRLTAQRRLADLGVRVLPRLQNVLAREEAPAQTRCHALWALEAIDGGRSARPLIVKIAANSTASPSLRRQAIRQLGTRRATEAAEILAAQLKDPDASIRFQAATALGRIGAMETVEHLLAALPEEDLFARYAVFHALNRIGRQCPRAWPLIARGLEHPDRTLRERAGFALRETYDLGLVETLVKMALDPSKASHARATAAGLLPALYQKTPEWRGEWWAYHPVNSPPPEKTIPWEGTRMAGETLRQCIRDGSPDVRLAAINGLAEIRYLAAAEDVRVFFAGETALEARQSALRALGAMRDAGTAPLLAHVLLHPEPRELLPDAVQAAANIGGPMLTDALLNLLRAPPSGASLTVTIMESLGRLKATAAAPLIAARLPDHDAHIRESAMEALAQIGSETAFPPVMALLAGESEEGRRAAVITLGKLRAKASIPSLLKAFEDSALRLAAIAALARMPDKRALPAYLAGLEEKSAAVRESCRTALSSIAAEALPLIEARLESIPAGVVTELRGIFAQNKNAARLLAFESKAPGLEDYESFAGREPGNETRGREIFFNENGVACVKCHAMEGRGTQIGPDLSGIGAQFGRAALIESILYPSKVVREGYNQIVIETRDGDPIAGLFKGETSDELRLLDASGRIQQIPKAQIKDRNNSTVSLMPEGLAFALTLPEFSDLISYLESRKTNASGKKNFR